MKDWKSKNYRIEIDIHKSDIKDSDNAEPFDPIGCVAINFRIYKGKRIVRKIPPDIIDEIIGELKIIRKGNE